MGSVVLVCPYLSTTSVLHMAKDNRIITGNSSPHLLHVLSLRSEKLLGLANFSELGLCFCNDIKQKNINTFTIILGTI